MTVPQNSLNDIEKSIYKSARDNIDKIIKDNIQNIQKHLRQITKLRTKIYLNLILEWMELYDENIGNIRNLIDRKNLQPRLLTAFFNYISFAFHYRFSKNNPNNIAFRKVFSFELHFFLKHNVIALKKGVTIPKSFSNKNEELFYTNPNLHFFYFRIIKEINVTIINNYFPNESAGDKLNDYLIESMRDKFLEYNRYLERNHNIENHYAFLDFLKSDENLKKFFEFIETEYPDSM